MLAFCFLHSAIILPHIPCWFPTFAFCNYLASIPCLFTVFWILRFMSAFLCIPFLYRIYLHSQARIFSILYFCCLVSIKSHHENEATWNPGLSDPLRKVGNWFVNSRNRLWPKILVTGRKSWKWLKMSLHDLEELIRGLVEQRFSYKAISERLKALFPGM